MASIPPDLLPRARQILLPLVTTADEREALLIEAFYSDAAALYSAIDRSGAPKIFAVNCLKKLLEYGALADGEHSLARLLRVAAIDYGSDKQEEIAALIELANLCHQANAEPTAPSLSAVPTPAPVLTIDTPRGQRPTSVFISYSRRDTEFAQQLIADLGQAGHACWIDTTAIKGGDEWVDTIAEGLRNSYALVIVVTATALASPWVRKEILWAEHRKKPIIPVLVEDVMQEDRFFPLVEYQAVKLFETGYPAALQKLLASLPKIEIVQPATATSSPEIDRRKLELSYIERLRLEELLNTEKYTPLAGTAQQQVKRAEMRAVFELLPMGKEREVLRETHRFENAVDEILKLLRAVLLGEPGGGKTTTIWKLAADLVAKALADRQEPIPLLIRLGRWTDAEQSLPDFIATQLGELGAYLPELLNENRAALLLDGLNELPTSQQQEKYPQVQRFIAQHPKLLVVISCRELDYTLDLGFDRINITPLDPLRIREFVGRYLGAERGEALFWRLAGERTRNYHTDFLAQVGAEHEAVFWLADHLPSHLEWTFDWDRKNEYGFWSEWRQHRETPSSLMVLARNPYMLLMLTSVYHKHDTLPDNRGELFGQFIAELLDRECRQLTEETARATLREEQQTLTKQLARLAFTMQTRRNEESNVAVETTLSQTEARTILTERQLYLAGSASILNLGEQIRFTHQLLQEYFAAQFMDNERSTGQWRAADIWKPERWWERTNWEEAAILLAGFYRTDCTPIVEWLAEANPEIAAQCMVRSGAELAPATRERLRALWLPRLTDVRRESNALARAAIGRALGQTGLDNRKGVGVMTDANGIVLPDIEWITIPGGEFPYGSDEEYSAQPQKITLPAFEISRYPITFVQFQTFLDDPEGYANPQWFDGLAANDKERQMPEQHFKFDNHPRDTVNWYQAIAFCRWLSWRLDGGYDLRKVDEWAVRLPTEFEWEKAARGTDGRHYPYRGKFNAAKGNTDETGIGQTSAVGIFPNGASPYGVEEMSGNVQEWCLSNYDKPASEARKENLRNKETRVLRGGSWYNFPDYARAVFRYYFLPSDRFNLIGFRVSQRVRPPSFLL